MFRTLRKIIRTHKADAQAFRALPMSVRARYDAAATTDENRRHWANADHLSPDAANNAMVRRTLRSRARYEVANNSYARGIVLTIANDCVGTGPRLQLLTEDSALNNRVEHEFGQWAEAVRLAETLRTMRMARIESGEVFALLASNPRLESPVKLDIRLIEADQVTAPWQAKRASLDGIVLDPWGNPIEYQILRYHPGSGAPAVEIDPVPASSVVHYYRVDRPGQHRGIPELTPALPLFAQLRRYTLAVIAAAETAADFAAVLFTDAPANGEADPVEAMDLVSLERRMATVLPGGWKLGQVQAEQPATTYGEFKNQILNEIARCMNVPFNVAAGNSSSYNYASGRLDHQTYHKSIRIDQHQLGLVVLDRILGAWTEEATLAGVIPQMTETPHQWFWDGQEHVDPLKEAKAQEARLANNTTTLAAEYARQGKDWEAELRQRAREVALSESLGLDRHLLSSPPPASEEADNSSTSPE